MRILSSLSAVLFFTAALPLHARLGETEAQSQQRYGAPAPELIGATDKPLLTGARKPPTTSKAGGFARLS